MIRIQKLPEPQILLTNKSKWTTDLLNLVSQYQSYDKIPQKEKDVATKNYRHSEILATLKGCNGLAKCVYCESSVDLTSPSTIEHYHPKSLYPNETFEWKNLFVCCGLCNLSKNDYDTCNQPFIHPENERPEDFLTFEDMMYVPKFKAGIERQKAENVITRCNLQRLPLIRAHAEILYSFRKSCDAMKEKLDDYAEYVQEQKKKTCISKVYSFLCELKEESSSAALYSGFMRYLLRKNEVVKVAVSLVNQHKSEVGLTNDFDWGFAF